MIDRQKQPGKIRPIEHLQRYSALYPLAWKQLNSFREMRGKDLPDWPEWCFCPLAGAYAVVSGGGGNRLNPDMVGDVSRVGALAAWRTTKTIFRFDSTLASALTDTDLNKLPVDILYRLPQWCVYIEAPNLDWFGLPVAGFFAHLENDANTGRSELRFLFDVDGFDGPELTLLQIHLNYENLGEGIDAALRESKRHMIDFGMTHLVASMPPDASREVITVLRPALSLLLYLCSDTMDVNGCIPQPPKPKKTKKGLKLFPADQPKVVEVGYKIGSALRAAYLAEQVGDTAKEGIRERKQPRPHVRKSHWHSFWKGSLDGERQIFVKWLPPIPVNIDQDGDLPVTIKNVRS